MRIEFSCTPSLMVRAIASFIVMLVAPRSVIAISSDDKLCAAWGEAKQIGAVDGKTLNEASGLAVSRKYGRLYHLNDSGNDTILYSTDRAGGQLKKIWIKGFAARDSEDLGIGPCPGKAATCLVFADIGDNHRRRKSIELAFIEERENFPSEVEPLLVAKLRYPDGSHNAEALGVLPNGAIVIVTKESKEVPARAYRLQPDQLKNANSANKEAVLESIGSLDIASLVGSPAGSLGAQVTGMSVSEHGTRFLLLTYVAALEFQLDLMKGSLPAGRALKLGREYSVVPITPLEQMEAIAYDVNDRDFLYTTEKPALLKRLFGGKSEVPVMAMSCGRRE